MLWCRLPDRRHAAVVARAALSQNVILAPGDVFSVSRSASDFMRFTVAQLDARAIDAIGSALGQ